MEDITNEEDSVLNEITTNVSGRRYLVDTDCRGGRYKYKYHGEIYIPHVKLITMTLK